MELSHNIRYDMLSRNYLPELWRQANYDGGSQYRGCPAIPLSRGDGGTEARTALLGIDLDINALHCVQRILHAD